MSHKIDGSAVLYQCFTQNEINAEQRAIANTKVTVGWLQSEIPRVCYGELPPVFLIKESAFTAPNFEYWVVGYTKFVAKTVSFVVYDNHNNFCLGRALRQMV